MESSDLIKIRRFALAVALILITLVVAGVRLETTVHMTPLGIPLVVQRPDLLTIGLVIAAIYSTLRFIYYGMLIQPSPMRARRELPTRMRFKLYTEITALETFQVQVQKDVDRYFPQIGKSKVTFKTTMDSNGCHVTEMKVPRVVRALCWIENFDFLLPVLANLSAVGLWLAMQFHAS